MSGTEALSRWVGFEKKQINIGRVVADRACRDDPREEGERKSENNRKLCHINRECTNENIK